MDERQQSGIRGALRNGGKGELPWHPRRLGRDEDDVDVVGRHDAGLVLVGDAEAVAEVERVAFVQMRLDQRPDLGHGGVGDEELDDGTKTDKIYAGKFFLNCSANDAPGVVGPDAKPLMNQEALYAGCIVRLDINPYPYSNSGNNGIGWGLNNVMLIRDGKRLDGKQNAEDAFSGFAGATAAEESDDLM